MAQAVRNPATKKALPKGKSAAVKRAAATKKNSPAPAKKKAPRKRKKLETNIADLGPIAQIKESVKPRNRLAAFTGVMLGGFVPLASYWIAHHEVVGAGYWMPVMVTLVFGGLIYSAKTVYQWARVAFDCPWKAVGFVVLLEGTMIFSNTMWLGVTALSLLIGMNAIATGCTLAKKG